MPHRRISSSFFKQKYKPVTLSVYLILKTNTHNINMRKIFLFITYLLYSDYVRNGCDFS